MCLIFSIQQEISCSAEESYWSVKRCFAFLGLFHDEDCGSNVGQLLWVVFIIFEAGSSLLPGVFGVHLDLRISMSP